MEGTGTGGTTRVGKSIDPIVWKSVAAGLVLTVAAFFVPVLSIVFHGMILLIHEMGHALAGWMVGHPSLPAFDFQYGGGVTVSTEQKAPLMWFLYACWGALAYRVKDHRKTLVVVVFAFVGWWLFTRSSFRHDWMHFMGHGMELVIAGVFLYRALSGVSLVDENERPLYAALGTFIVAWDFRWALDLIVDTSARAQYFNAKGNIHANDFVKLARSFGVDLSAIAFLFLLLCVATPVITWAVFWWDEEIRAWLRRWRGVSGAG